MHAKGSAQCLALSTCSVQGDVYYCHSLPSAPQPLRKLVVLGGPARQRRAWDLPPAPLNVCPRARMDVGREERCQVLFFRVNRPHPLSGHLLECGHPAWALRPQCICPRGAFHAYGYLVGGMALLGMFVLQSLLRRAQRMTSEGQTVLAGHAEGQAQPGPAP